MTTQQFTNLSEVKIHLQHLVKYMESTIILESAARFIVPCSFIDYLSKLYKGGGGENYKKFIKEIMSEVNPKYIEFEYKGENEKPIKDLPVQMYHILRCGIVHSFSLIPDKTAKDNGGRKRSIVLGFNEDKEKYKHLDNYSDKDITDACIFILDDFISDLNKSIEVLFAKAEKKNEDGSNSDLERHILDWVKKYPLIGAIKRA